MDIRFGKPLPVAPALAVPRIMADVHAVRPIDFNDVLPSLTAMRRQAGKLTREYMAAIYAMTTVNHDHLFASLLKMLPGGRIKTADFRRRVFLLTRTVTATSGGRCHKSLAIGQVALLTDDRYHKYRDFLLLALESGLLRQEGDLLVRLPGRFRKAVDINRIRIDNPLAVIANEVTPLRALRRSVLVTAWLPSFLVRSRVANILRQEDLRQFRDDYRAFFKAGESKAESIGSPRLMPGRNRALGILLIHGFLAAPREMLATARYLNARGYPVYLVRLRGHGTAPEDLASRTAEDWLESVDRGYGLLSTLCQRVAVGGFSFGGGLALDCAARISTLAGVFAVAPPARLRDLSSRFVPAVAFWNRILTVLQASHGRKEFLEIHPEQPDINYSRLPIASLWEMEKFMKALAGKLVRIQQPVLIVQSVNDPVVDAAGTEKLYEGIGSPRKRFLSVDLGRHGILHGAGSDDVLAALGEFVAELERNGPG
jgi:esterase/lipase